MHTATVETCAVKGDRDTIRHRGRIRAVPGVQGVARGAGDGESVGVGPLGVVSPDISCY